jgi:hypothetical protein
MFVMDIYICGDGFMFVLAIYVCDDICVYICDIYVISFVCVDGIKKQINRYILVTLPSVTLGKEALCRVSGS